MISICNVSDFQLEKNVKVGQKLEQTFIFLLDLVHEAPFANLKMERQRWTTRNAFNIGEVYLESNMLPW